MAPAQAGAAQAGAAVAAPDTLRLKNKHTEEVTQGLTDKPFEVWLQENGYALGQDNQARHAVPPPAAAPVDTRPRTPDFLYRGREQAR